jgi:hypothetical protein
MMDKNQKPSNPKHNRALSEPFTININKRNTCVFKTKAVPVLYYTMKLSGMYNCAYSFICYIKVCSQLHAPVALPTRQQILELTIM